MYYGNTVAGPVFKEIADNIYKQEIHLQPTNMQAENGLSPYSKSGNAQELRAVLDELEIPHSTTENAAADWIITTAKNDGVFLQKRFVGSQNVPNVIGMSAKDALYILENRSMRVQITGRGTVTRQSIAAGKVLITNQAIRLELN